MSRRTREAACLIKTKHFLKFLKALLAIFLMVGAFVTISNVLIITNGKKSITTYESMCEKKPDCILILGAGVGPGNKPSPMLADRLEEGIKLYKAGVAPKILVSGDHGKKDYDEVNVMKKYLMDAGICDEDIFMDHAGFSTYESMYRAKEVFGVKKLVIVTQKYHLYRAVYIAEKLGMETYGSPACDITYSGAFMRNIREWLARDKDIFTCFLKIKPTYLGEKIDIHGSGTSTND